MSDYEQRMLEQLGMTAEEYDAYIRDGSLTPELEAALLDHHWETDDG